MRVAVLQLYVSYLRAQGTRAETTQNRLYKNFSLLDCDYIGTLAQVVYGLSKG